MLILLINTLGRIAQVSGQGHDMLILLINTLGRIAQVRVMTC